MFNLTVSRKPFNLFPSCILSVLVYSEFSESFACHRCLSRSFGSYVLDFSFTLGWPSRTPSVLFIRSSVIICLLYSLGMSPFLFSRFSIPNQVLYLGPRILYSAIFQHNLLSFRDIQASFFLSAIPRTLPHVASSITYRKLEAIYQLLILESYYKYELH